MPHTPTLAVVWLDFHQAKIFLIKADDVEAKRIKADTPHRQVHHKAQVRGSGHVRDDRTYFEAILAAVQGVDAWLIVGPGGTKKDLEKYFKGHAGELKQKLVGVEPMDRPHPPRAAGARPQGFQGSLPDDAPRPADRPGAARRNGPRLAQAPPPAAGGIPGGSRAKL